MDGLQIIAKAKRIREIYPKLNQYFEFEYANIGAEIINSIGDDYESVTQFNTACNIDHLPDDFPIYFLTKKVGILELIEKYEFTRNDSYVSDLIMTLLILIGNRKNALYGIVENEEMNVLHINPDKRRLYEFLLDNYKEYDYFNLPKTQITIFYGQNSQITIDNHENWLYRLLKIILHQDLTFGGHFEYNRIPNVERPSRAPQFHNYIIYNLYLLLIDVVGSEKKNPVIFRKFILDFCKLCDIELIGQQTEDIGIKDLINAAKRQYKDIPIPYSIVRK